MPRHKTATLKDHFLTGFEALHTANRKLIRPSLLEVKEHMQTNNGKASHAGSGNGAAAKKNVPHEQTNAENYYYVKQMQAKTPMVVVLADGEKIRGVVEWYDRTCIKLNRDDAPNLMIYKRNIKYLYKEEDESESEF